MAKFYNKSTYLRRKELWFALLFIISLFLVVAISKAVGERTGSDLQSVSIWYLFVILLIVLGYPLAKIFLRKSDLYSQGLWGEQSIGKELRNLSDEFFVFHGLRVPGVGDIDYVVIGPTGVFAIEVKSHRGSPYRMNQLIPRFVRQTKYESQQLRRYIEKQTGKSVWVEGVLALSRGRVNYRQAEGVHVLERGQVSSFLETFQPKQADFYNLAQKLAKLFV